MALRTEIVKRAQWWAEPGEYRVFPSHLIYFFERAGTERVPTEKDAKEAMGYPGGVKVDGGMKQWCGVFAAAVLAECGMNVKWTLMGGKISQSTALKYVTGNQGMQPGDIALIAKAQHHFIVIEADYSKNTLVTVDGNQARQTIKLLNTRKIRYTSADASLMQPYGYYRIGG